MGQGNPDLTIPIEVVQLYLTSVALLVERVAPEMVDPRLWHQVERQTRYLARMVADAQRRRPTRVGGRRVRMKEKTV